MKDEARKRSRRPLPLRSWVVIGTVVTTLVGLVVLLIFARLQAGRWVWTDGFYLNGAHWFDAARTTVALVGIIGLGGAAFLAYRKQLTTESTHRLEEVRALRSRYTTCAEQLGNDSPAIRQAGVYALASLADDWHTFDNDDERQVCVDLLCAYLRTGRPSAAAVESAGPISRRAVGERKPHRLSPNPPQPPPIDPQEREVRAAILDVIRQRRVRIKDNWADCLFNLSTADLSNVYLDYASLSGVSLYDANLTDATLYEANLVDANLALSTLRGADLGDADLAGADLFRANLTGANLAQAKLGHANLTEANLTGATLYGTNLARAYLGGANFTAARYDDETQWPDRFTPPAEAMRLIQNPLT